MMAAGKAPDIFYTNSTMRDRLAAEGRILDLRTLCQGDSLPGRLWPHVIANGSSEDGGWYSLGNWEFTCGVYYRKDLFSDAGLAPPDSSWTWDDMVAAGAETDPADGPGGRGGRYGIFIGSHFVEALELMNGASVPREMLLLKIPRNRPNATGGTSHSWTRGSCQTSSAFRPWECSLRSCSRTVKLRCLSKQFRTSRSLKR